MIPRTLPTWQTTAPWQTELARAVRNPAELVALLGLPAELLPQAQRAAQQFPLRVPRGYVARMRKGDPHDPLLRQVLPLGEELRGVPGFSADPVGDLGAMASPGLLHKYQGRVLLITTGACAIHCRYCFRRHFPYGEAQLSAVQWQEALDYIRADASIEEVILSGGDPLALTDARLAALLAPLENIPHLRRLRLHSRLPVVLPERVTTALVNLLSTGRLTPVLVVHANHANEIDSPVRQALEQLRTRGVTLLNQAVLLAGVNDNAVALAELSEALFGAGVLPYYLHLLDKVSGAAHFDVPEAAAMPLMEALRARLPGYLVPRLVREQAGAPFKLPIAGA